MQTTEPAKLTIQISDSQSVSALICVPPKAEACYVFAHGAGAGMEHPFMAKVALELADRKIATLRYQFAYMERGSKRPDAPRVARAAVRAAVVEAGQHLPGVPLFAGGKSFGGRMTSQAQAESPLEGVRGLVFLGFPLHPAGEPSQDRAAHLSGVRCPMLFLQGTRDELAEATLLQGVVSGLGGLATLKFFDDADHSFHVRRSSGQTDDQIRTELVETMEQWFAAQPA
jgi:uncharacterized protein